MNGFRFIKCYAPGVRLVLNCQNSLVKKNIALNWKAACEKSNQPCKAKVIFSYDSNTKTYRRTHMKCEHNHSFDYSVIPDRLVHYLEQYLASRVYTYRGTKGKPGSGAMDVIKHLRETFGSLIDKIYMPTVLHLLS